METSTILTFAASAVVGALGIAAIAKTPKCAYSGIAMLPIMFAAVEFLKGMSWDPGNTKTSVTPPALLAYLVLSLVLMPTMVPIIFLYEEKNAARQKKLKALLMIGISISMIYAGMLIGFDCRLDQNTNHFQCVPDFPMKALDALRFLYILPVVLPFFVSHLKGAKWVGMFLFGSYMLSIFYFGDNFPQIPSLMAIVIGLSSLWLIIRLKPKRKIASG